MTSLSKRQAQRGFEKGRQINQILDAVRQDFGPDARGAVNYELRKGPTDQDISKTVERALQLFQAQQAAKQVDPTPQLEQNRYDRATRETIDQLPRSPGSEMKEFPPSQLPFSSRGQALYEGLVTSLAGIPGLPIDMAEWAVDQARGTTSPSRTRQLANFISTQLGGPEIPQHRMETPQDSPLRNYELLGELMPSVLAPSAITRPLKAIGPSNLSRLRRGASLDYLNSPRTTARELSTTDYDELTKLKEAAERTPEKRGIPIYNAMFEGTEDDGAKFVRLDPTDEISGGYAVIQPSGYVSGIMADEPGTGFASTALRTLGETYPELRLHGVPATSALERYYQSKGIPMDQFAKGGLARVASRLSKDSSPARKSTADVIKEKGGNWLTGSVEGALRGLKKRGVWPDAQTAEELGAEGRTLQAQRGTDSLNNWIDKQLTRYVKNEMATPEDPIRALAERGVLHMPEDAVMRNVDSATYGNRGAAGFNPWGVAETNLGRQWENIADRSIRGGFAGKMSDAARLDNPWLSKLQPEDRVYQPSRIGVGETGFSHLIDELSNSLNPESGLPRELLLDPASLPRVSVPQAVERVAKINAWRAAQKAEADAMLANNAATRIHKEYAENNPLGLRWVELTDPDPDHPSEQNWEALKQALKYEGDTMGHCVGGYCDDVLSGRSRIYSLRDAKGQPHVTIETKPGLNHWSIPDELKGMDEIIQIKGKQNRAPNEEYLPFVQDFVKSGKWSDVGDLQNTGLEKFVNKERGVHYMTPEEYRQMLIDKAEKDTMGFADGGLARSEDSLNDDIMQNLLQIAAEKYQQFAPRMV